LQKNRYVQPISPEATLVSQDVFRFLAVERRCSTAAGWQPPDAEKLWVYNLHYFDDLNAREAPVRREWHDHLLRRWVAENPPGRGDGWEPYPVSRRIVNWVKWTAVGNTLPYACHTSLAVQARWLVRRLEYHLLGNHLLANAKALIYAGLYFDGSEAEAWYARAFDLFEEQLQIQLLADGGHFELSPMYHAVVLEDVLDLVNILQAHGRQVPSAWVASVASMRRWLSVMSHPDGEIAFFNDAAFEVAANAAELDAYAARLGLPSRALPVEAPIIVLESSGYVRLAVGAAQVLCDCASVGPDHLPAHAHADSLSFEMSLGQQRVFVNSGVSQYGTDAERQRQRGTGAHNTVVVNGEDSSEVWGGFRVARRARARIHQLVRSPPLVVQATHDGYTRLPGRNEHRRRWTLAAGSLEIDDEVTGAFRSAQALFHLYPQITVRASEPQALVLDVPGQPVVRMSLQGASSIEIRPSTWHPQFGLSVPNTCVAATLLGPTLRTRILWAQER